MQQAAFRGRAAQESSSPSSPVLEFTAWVVAVLLGRRNENYSLMIQGEGAKMDAAATLDRVMINSSKEDQQHEIS
jgi:hypothetical protein